MTVAPILRRALRDGALFSLAVAIGASLTGWFVSGVPGLVGGLLGAVLSFVYLGLTAASMLVAGRVSGGDMTHPAYFGIILGTLVLKIVLFLVFALWLRGQDWLDTTVFFWTVILSVAGTLVLDAVALQRARVPYVSDVTLPGEERPSDPDSDGSR